MFAHPYCVHRQEAKLLVGAEISCKETRDRTVVWLETFNGCVPVERKQWLSIADVRVRFEQSFAFQISQIHDFLFWWAVDNGRINVGRDLVHLFTRSHRAEKHRGGAGTAHSAWASKLHAPVSFNTVIVSWDRNRKARRLIITNVVLLRAIETVAKSQRTQTADNEVDVVI